MKEPYEIKIMACDTDAISSSRIGRILLKHQYKNVIINTVPKYLIWMVAAHKPDFILTDNNLWNDYDAISLIKELRQANNTPVIIWTNKATEKIFAAVFHFDNVLYIQKSEDDSLLLEFISKTVAEGDLSS